MNDTSTSPAEKTGGHSFRAIAWTVLIVITLYVCYFSHLGAFGFIGPDEPRYAWIARDMAESGDWVTPRLFGQPWFEKPVLYYWSAAASFKLFGVSEVSARLPGALFALFATMGLAWFALRMFGWKVARWVLLLLPSTVGMIAFSHAASPDMLFSAMLTGAMICAAVALDLVPLRGRNQESSTDSGEPETSSRDVADASSRYLSLSLFGFFLGAAALAKGPAAIILTGGAIVLWILFTRRWRDSLQLLHPVAIGAFLLTSLPWYVLCACRNPEFWRVFIIEHNFNRYLTPEFQHLQPFWYYIPITLMALLPWACWLAWFAFREARTFEGSSQRAQILFLAAWALFPLLFFSLSKSKLPGYILPAVPAFVLLISLAATREMKSKQAFSHYALGFSGAFFLVSGCWAVFSKTGLAGSLVHFYAFSAALGGFVVISLALLRHTRAGLVSAIVVQLFLLTLVYVAVGRLDPQLSARASAAQIGAARTGVTYSLKLQRAWQYQLNFYLHREVLEWNPDVSGQAIVVTTEKNLAELKNSAEIIAVISDYSPQAEIVAVKPLTLARDVPGSGQPR
jgi:4-amino-4-deoxy-L-arabinose transferase-like glycosyltransferase